MSARHHHSPTAGERVAQLAIAQYLLFGATIESLSLLGERLTARGEPAPVGDLAEPFRSRYALLKRMVEEEQQLNS